MIIVVHVLSKIRNIHWILTVALVITATACSQGRDSSSSSNSRSNRVSIVSKTDCVTLLGQSSAIETQYSDGSITVELTGGAVALEPNVYVRWCKSPRGSNSSNSATQKSTSSVVYASSLGCGAASTTSFEQFRDGTSNVTCHSVLPNGATKEVRPTINGRRGKVLRTASMTSTDNSDHGTICFGLFDDGQIVVASKILPVGTDSTCEDWFLSNTKPAAFAKGLQCPASGDLTILETAGGDETSRCVVTFSDGRKSLKRLGEGTYFYPSVDYVFFRDARWQGKFCITMDRNGVIRSYEVLEETSECE